ncbi:MAG: transglycosylase SLT domain-containing protein [Methylocella sp.]
MADPSTDGLGAALAASPNFINPAYATPAQRQQLYAYANELMKPQPVKSVAQGFGELARALVGGYTGHLADQQEQNSYAAQVGKTNDYLNSPQGAGSSPPGAQTAASDISGPILQQESGNNPNVAPSVDGARGQGQIMPATFAAYAKPGESIDNPSDNLAVHHRIIADYQQRYGGDPARVAVAYFSGPGNVAPPGSPTPWIADREDGNGKTVSSYVNDVTGRVKLAGPVPTPNSAPQQPAATSAPTVRPVANPQRNAAAASLLAMPDLNPATAAILQREYSPQTLEDPYGGFHFATPAQGAGPSVTPQVHFGGVAVPGFAGETTTSPGPTGAPQTQVIAPSPPQGGPQAGNPLAGAAPLVNAGIGFKAAEDEAGKDVDTLATYRNTGVQAKATLGMLDQAEQLGQKANYGFVPLMQNFLGKYGIKTDNLPDQQAYTAAVYALGATSPQIAGAFASSPPNLLTPEGRQIAFENLKTLANYQAKVGEIAGDRSIPVAERMTRIQALPPPTPPQAQQSPAPGSATASPTAAAPPVGFRQAKDGAFYAPDPNRPGKFVKWTP